MPLLALIPLLALLALLPPPTRPVKNHPNGPGRRGNHNDELSEFGRDPRFVSGWWIVPGLFIWSLIALAFALAGMRH
jgi:hypothetical protein